MLLSKVKEKDPKLSEALENLKRIQKEIAPFVEKKEELTLNPPSGEWRLTTLFTLQKGASERHKDRDTSC